MALINQKEELTLLTANAGRTGANGYAIHLGSPWKGKPVVGRTGSAEVGYGLERGYVQCPLSIGTQGMGMWQLPFDPMIGVQSKNIISRRYVAKSQRRGSIKELWSMDDWDIEISGVLIGESEEELQQMVGKLRGYCQEGESLMVECEYLSEAFDIQRMVVESYDFPHTKGMTNQTFTLKCYSDEDYDLLIGQ